MTTHAKGVTPSISRGAAMGGWWPLPRQSTWFYPARYRLTAMLKAYETELELHIQKRCAEEPADWACKSRSLLQQAHEAAERGDLITAWPCFHAAKRIEAAALVDPDDLAIRVFASRIESSEKLTGWRREAVMKLLTPEAGQSVSALALAKALQIIHEDSDNFYYLMSLRKSQLTIPMVILVLTVASILLCAWRGPLSLGTAPTMGEPAMLTAVVQFGIMGASLSAVFSLVAFRGKIREHVLSSTVTLLRPILGAAAALGIYAFMVSGILNVGTPLAPGRVLAVAFAAGFSERLIIRTISGLTREKAPDEPKGA